MLRRWLVALLRRLLEKEGAPAAADAPSETGEPRETRERPPVEMDSEGVYYMSVEEFEGR